MPNQFGIDNFDFDDAFNKQNENMCSKDLKEFIIDNHLNLNLDKNFNPRLAFGSHSDSDHTYNTPRAWYITKYLNPNKYDYETKLTPESDNIPWSNIPERKITIEDVKYLLSSHYQGTVYDPYAKLNGDKFKPIYRPIGISRTSFIHISQIRPYVNENIASIQWLGFGSNVFNTLIPIYTNVNKMPNYISNTTIKVSTNNFYWASRLIGALVDSHFQTSIVYIERYQNKTMSKNHELIKKYDNEYIKKNDITVLRKANDEISKNIQNETEKTLANVLYHASNLMKNSFSRSDN